MLDGTCFLRKRKTLAGKSSRSSQINPHFNRDIHDVQKVHKEWEILLVNDTCTTALRIDELKWSSPGEGGILQALQNKRSVRERNNPQCIIYPAQNTGMKQT